jgi:STE24 endopeptidase
LNLYGIVILSALLFEYALNLAAEALNLARLEEDLPEEMSGVYNAEIYRKSQEYTRVTTRFGIVTSTFGLAVTLTFWFAAGFNTLDQWVRNWGFGPVPTGLAYIGLLLLFRALFSLPFSVYATFVIEERFGFNRTTPLTFLADRTKGLLLSILLGGPLLALLLLFFEYAGPHAWLYAWLLGTLYILFIQFVAPTWIMPLFNKFEPLGAGELRERIFAYAGSVDFPIENVFVMDGSRRSSKSNAFFTGFGRHKRIALFDTLIAKHTVPELVAVLAHEIGHYKKKHIAQGIVLSIFHMGLMFFLLSFFLKNPGLYEAFYMETQSVYAGLLFFGLLFTPVEFILSIFFQLLSRHNEYEADRFSAATIDRPEAMAEALKKLSAHNLSNLTPHPFYVFLNYSHPPVLERIRAIRRRKRIAV